MIGSRNEPIVLAAADWRPREQAHQERVMALTAAHRLRREDGIPHPVEDFLFTYYQARPRQLARWYPGAGYLLADADDRTDWRFHRRSEVAPAAVEVAVDEFYLARGTTVTFIESLLLATAGRTGNFGCFGLHEWAMVYRTPDHRHISWPLRLGQDGTDAVVAEHQVRCSHFDAYRFFTEPARPLNQLRPTIERRVELEQPGCLHVGMDLYKWAFKLLPLVSSELVMDCFELARDIRELDMRASPYDLSALGYRPVPIETPEGKAEYVAQQRAFTARAQPLRERILAELSIAGRLRAAG